MVEHVHRSVRVGRDLDDDETVRVVRERFEKVGRAFRVPGDGRPAPRVLPGEVAEDGGGQRRVASATSATSCSSCPVRYTRMSRGVRRRFARAVDACQNPSATVSAPNRTLL
jgi:hypothetical protein